MICLNVNPGETEWTIELNLETSASVPEQTIRLESAWDKVDFTAERMFFALHIASHVYVVIGRTLLATAWPLNNMSKSLRQRARTIVVEEFSDTPTRMVEAPRHSVPRIVLSFPQGARAIWTERKESCALAMDLVNPITAFTPNGLLVAACTQSDRLEFYRLAQGHAELIGATPAAGTVQHLTCGTAPNEIMVFRENGMVERLQIPVR